MDFRRLVLRCMEASDSESRIFWFSFFQTLAALLPSQPASESPQPARSEVASKNDQISNKEQPFSTTVVSYHFNSTHDLPTPTHDLRRVFCQKVPLSWCDSDRDFEGD